MTALKIIALTLALAVGVVFFTLYRNDAHLGRPPGMKQRLAIFLTTNMAVTSDDPVLDELRTPVFELDSEELYRKMLLAASKLGWTVASLDSDNQSAHFIVHSPMFLFEDDVYVQVNFLNMGKSSLYIRSISRRGKADFAANSSHIQRLIQKVRSL